MEPSKYEAKYAVESARNLGTASAGAPKTNSVGGNRSSRRTFIDNTLR